MYPIVGTVINPAELYRAYDRPPSFYCLTNEEENHNGFQYHTGLCVDIKNFNSSDKCSLGGLYFFERSQLNRFEKFTGKVKYIRDVTFPSDARIYVEDGGFKADKFILGERKNLIIFVDPIMEAVKQDGLALQFVKDKTPELCMAAVKQNGLALQFVKEQTYELCMAAVMDNGRALQYVKEQTDELCMAAVMQNGLALEHVKEQTYELCMAAAMDNGRALQYVKEQTDELCMAAVTQDGMALQYVKEQTHEICMAAVMDNERALQYVKEQTDELCMAAVKQDGRALEYVKEPNDEICIAAVTGGMEWRLGTSDNQLMGYMYDGCNGGMTFEYIKEHV